MAARRRAVIVSGMTAETYVRAIKPWIWPWRGRATRAASAITLGALSAAGWVLSALLVAGGAIGDDPSRWWNTTDVVSDLLLMIGLAGVLALRPASGRLLRAGAAVVRARRWRGWRRFTPLACGLVPFAVELPGFLTVGDKPELHFFIACTGAAWLALFLAAGALARQGPNA